MAICLADGACQHLVAHHAPVHIEKLGIGICALFVRTRSETVNARRSRLAGKLHEIIEKSVPENLIYPLLEARDRGGIDQRPPFAFERESDFRMGQSIMGHQPRDMPQFRIVGPEKLSSGGNIEKQIAHRDLGSLVPGGRLDGTHDTAMNFDFRPRNGIRVDGAFSASAAISRQ